METFAVHYSELYSRDNIVSPKALAAIECTPVMEELDAEPTVQELRKAIDSLASGRAPESDGIPKPHQGALQDHPTVGEGKRERYRRT